MPDGRSAADDTLSALARAKLRPAERRVAAVVAERGGEVKRMSIAALAAAAGVSEPTVHRFCRALGCTGFPEFKLHLAEGLASGTPWVHRDVAIGDPPDVVVEKIFESTQRAFADLRANLDRRALAAAAARLGAAKRIECFGAGIGAAMALDAQIRLMRLGIPAVWHPDGHTQAMAAAGLGPGDVAIALGVHGAAPELVRAAAIARRAGAGVIGLARSGAPLAAASDVFLAVDTAEDTAIFTPTVSRLAVLLVVDILTTAVMAARGPAIVEQLRRVKQAVQPPATTRHARNARNAKGGTP